MRIVSVAGSSPCSPEESASAHEVGRLLAGRGVAVACGGLGGVMEAVCRGARETGGTTIGLLPGTDAGEANDAVQIALPTGLGEARNVLVASAGEALIAIGTGFGTLSEMAFALKRGRRVVSLDSWDLRATRDEAIPGFHVVATPAEAVATALGG
jgi:uncharacterized protein (TIGR00725 family)